jgi:asparagine synthase (glutamine-hydrolysing)
VLVIEEDGRSSLRRYWELRCGPKRAVATAADEAKVEEETLAILDEATRLRLISDVPLGAFLSGGVDSSAVVASMTRAATGAVKTFSIGFDEKDYDESEHAALVARHLGTAHEALVLRPPADPAKLLEKIAWHYGEPFADTSCVPTFAVSELARSRVTVALSGDGGDELFLGYGRYVGTQLDGWLQDRALLGKLATSRPALATLLLLGRRDLANLLGHARWNQETDAALRYVARVEHFAPVFKRPLVTADFARTAAAAGDARRIVADRITASDGDSLVEKAAHADFTTYLPDDILVKVDVASMAFGLETRAPLLDHVLAEHVARLPSSMKMKGLATKAFFKKALRPRLPAATLERKKMGFGVPLDHWFRGSLATLLEETLFERRSLERGIVDEKGLRALVAEHRRGVDRQYLLFNLLMLELWHRTFVDARRPSAAARP